MKSSGQISHTVQIEYARFISPVIRKRGFMTTSETKKYIKDHFPLNEADWRELPCGVIRWHQVVRNLKSNRVFEDHPELGVLNVKGGFQYIGGME